MEKLQSANSQLLPPIQAEGGSNIVQNRGEQAEYVKEAALRAAADAADQTTGEPELRTQESELTLDNAANQPKTRTQNIKPHPPPQPRSQTDDTRVIPANTMQTKENSEEGTNPPTTDANIPTLSELQPMSFEALNRKKEETTLSYINLWTLTDENVDERIIEIRSVISALTEAESVLFQDSKQLYSMFSFLKASLNKSIFGNHKLYEAMVKEGAWFTLITNMAQKTLLEAERRDRTDSHMEQLHYSFVNVYMAIGTIHNGTDRCRDPATMQITFDHFFDWIFHQLSSDNLFTRQLKRDKERTRTSAPYIIASSLLSILHNLSYYFQSCIPAMREKGMLLLARKLRENTQNSEVQAKCLLIIAYVLEEGSDNELMEISEVELKHLIRLLDDKIKDSDSSGYHIEELIDGLKQIAVNDTNKSKLIDNGILPLLVLCLQSTEHTEQAAAARAIHTLAFTEESRQKIVSQEGCMTGLHAIKSSESMEVRKAAGGALWELEGKTKHAEDIHNSSSMSSSVKHIMLSYNHLAQKEVVKIKRRLEDEGYAVWFDEERITEGGSTLEAMAEAIENCSLVLMFFSEAYRNSANCRSEAEYAHQKKKTILPVLVQSKYEADGWLGMIIGLKFYFNITKRNTYEQVVSSLISSIKSKTGGQQDTTDEPDHPRQVLTLDRRVSMDFTPKTSIPVCEVDALECYTWTAEQVDKWLSENGLEKLKDRNEPMDGTTLSELAFLSHFYPDSFYSLVQRSSDSQELSFWKLVTFGHKVKQLFNRRV